MTTAQPFMFPSLSSAGNPHTAQAYESDLKAFREFIARIAPGTPVTPPMASNLIVQYIKHCSAKNIAWATLRRRLCALRSWYQEHDVVEDPRRYPPVARAIEDAKNADDRRKTRRPAATELLINRILDRLDADYDAYIRPTHHITLTYLRDRALLLTIYTAALTRSEASTLRRDDIRRDPQDRASLILTVNPTGELVRKNGERAWIAPKRNRDVRLGRAVDPTRDPVRALQQWITVAAIPQDGYVFRGVLLDGSLTGQLAPRSIQHIIAARRALVDDAGILENVSTHSIRLGRAAQLARAGKTNDEIADVMGVATTVGVDFDSSLADVVARGRRLRENAPEREPLIL